MFIDKGHYSDVVVHLYRFAPSFLLNATFNNVSQLFRYESLFNNDIWVSNKN